MKCWINVSTIRILQACINVLDKVIVHGIGPKNHSAMQIDLADTLVHVKIL